jgi:hypothetical protein
MFDVNFNLRGVKSDTAVAINEKEEWPILMAKTYGGRHEEFTAASGKPWQGWYFPVQNRLDMFLALEAEGNLIKSLDAFGCDGVRGKLDKAAKRLRGGADE